MGTVVTFVPGYVNGNGLSYLCLVRGRRRRRCCCRRRRVPQPFFIHISACRVVEHVLLDGVSFAAGMLGFREYVVSQRQEESTKDAQEVVP